MKSDLKIEFAKSVTKNSDKAAAHQASWSQAVCLSPFMSALALRKMPPIVLWRQLRVDFVYVIVSSWPAFMHDFTDTFPIPILPFLL